MPPSMPALIDEAEPAPDEVLDAITDVVGEAPGDDGGDVADGRRPRPSPAPGDGLLAMTTAAMAGVSAVGLGIALAGRVLRFPRLPASVQGAVVALDHQPRLRRLLEERIGKRATDTALGAASTAANALAVAPSILAVDLAINTFKAAEARAVARAWSRREPELGRPATGSAAPSASRPVPSPAGPVENHLQRSTWVQAIGATVVGAASRDPNLAGTAALVAVPKAARSTQESFTATLGRGLANNDEALQVEPDSLRRLDRIDVVIVDPRILRSAALRLVRLRGAGEKDLTTWERAQAMLAAGDLQPGWHRVAGTRRGKARPITEALFAPAPHPLAAATLAETQRADVQTITVDDSAGLGELRPAFDEIAPMPGDSVDDALLDAVHKYQQEGHTVAVVSSAAAQALSAADLGVGIRSEAGPAFEDQPHPLDADLIVDDLAGVWRVLHALPAAKEASRRGVELSIGASALGSLLLIPTVRGRGPGPVVLGAAAGLLSGYWSARKVVNAPLPRPVPVDEWHAMSVEQVRAALASSAEPTFAPRAADNAGRHTIWQFFDAVRDELSDPLTPVLGLGATATAILGSPIDALLVGSVLASNAVLAAGQRLSAELRLNRLLADQIPPAWKVTIRPDGTRERVQVLPEQLQRGDLIEVGPDDVVPADARVIEQEKLEVDEASLTGESLPVTKQIDATPGAELAERRCMLFAGTTVAAGTGLALVTAVGPDTEVRRAADLVTSRHGDIGLGHQLGQITNRTWPLSLVAGGLVSALGVLRGTRLQQAVAHGVSVAVAAVPEGMPVVATLAQHASAQRLTKSGVLVRVPRSVEALGRVDVVCFDKTGTLSENRLRVTEVRTVSDHSRDEVLRCAVRATPSTKGQSHVDATDAAIVTAAAPVPGAVASEGPDAHLPFRSGRPFAASVFGSELTIKGAPEVVLAACESVPADINDVVEQLADDGLRVLAVARRELSPAQLQSLSADPDDPEAQLAAMARQCADGLTLVGFVGISDTPRAGSAGLLAELHRRQVPVRMITGDHPTTGRAIARKMGLQITAEQVITGTEWETLSGKEQERAVAEKVVFARMSPANKVQVVQALERSGKVSAMVGDGANDAAAIRAATVGIGIVAQGSDAAHTAADVVLLDGRIETLLDALNEGSQLWQRVQAAVAVLLGGNASGALFAIVGSALTGQAPLNTRQLLLVNIVTDAFPATALAISQPRRPMPFGGRGPDEKALLRAVTLRGTTTASATLAAWFMARVTGFPRRASTVALVALVTTQLGQTLLESRSPLVLATAGGSFAAMALLISLPGISQFMGCTPLGPIGWAQALGSAAVAITAAGIAPRFFSRAEAA
ncbi:cation-translocating P-type ATPase [Mycolicibacter sinensis]|uniref:Haloacid dehalogenase n=1 Tax=Mycolicibacter sinensis (strain JDM601) TaxID=875328 RepID=A0A1A2NLC9_MYCSD|nr:cation-translocating P-type ATPase [Mycolicibacter sinensis]OBH15889.1 haloacid dehalogenase [Mycolicibacter sinensis]OBI31253.1 haloacid dehalogenase [Mycolicibacter sinensis]